MPATWPPLLYRKGGEWYLKKMWYLKHYFKEKANGHSASVLIPEDGQSNATFVFARCRKSHKYVLSGAIGKEILLQSDSYCSIPNVKIERKVFVVCLRPSNVKLGNFTR